MRSIVICAGIAIGIVSFARAEVNCELVRKNMSRPGATVEDISMTMVIPEDEIRKCLESESGDESAKAAEPDEE